MVGFEAQLAASARPQWTEHYLDYKTLKRCIRTCQLAQQRHEAATQANADAAAAPAGTGLGAGSRALKGAATAGVEALLKNDEAAEVAAADASLADAKSAFQRQLDSQVLKVLRFYKQRSQEVVQAVDQLRAEASSQLEAQEQMAGLLHSSAHGGATLEVLGAALQRAVQETTQLLQYISLNMTAIRKVLKKFAKNVGGEMKAPSPGFLALEVEHPDDAGWRVLQGTFLPAQVADELQDMQSHTALLGAMHTLQGLSAELRRCREELQLHASFRMPSQGEITLGAIAEEVEGMQDAEDEAARHAALVHAMPWAERAAGMFEPPPPDAYAVATLSGLLINNLSTLLFMMNYTAVLPPTDALCVHLGVPSSYTGLIMAASDLAALVSSIGISFWTQHSFKRPLLAAGVSCLAGNAVFVLAYQRRSLALLLGARLLNGLGSARVANRRYTADYVHRAKRTMASAAFVGASNLGMALGPLLSLPLAYLPEGASLAGLPFNSITAVGVIMALLWAAFMVGAALCFQDPPKRLPIGLARGNTLLLSDGPPTSRDASPCRLSRDLSAAAATAILASHASNGNGSSSLQQPLLGAVHDREPAGGGVEAHVGDEEAPLLPHARRAKQAEAEVKGDKRRAGAAAAAWKVTVPGTLACTLALFVQKMVQQNYMDSLPIITESLLSWRTSQVGLFMGLVSLAMVPVNAAVGAASSRLSDRLMVTASLLLCMLCLVALALGTPSPAVFFGAGVLLFVGTVVLEGTATSLMSKCIWRGFAQGVLNAGLLSTEAGTLGRFAGNALLAIAGRLTGLEGRGQVAAFARLLNFCLLGACSAMLATLACTYRRLRG